MKEMLVIPRFCQKIQMKEILIILRFCLTKMKLNLIKVFGIQDMEAENLLRKLIQN